MFTLDGRRVTEGIRTLDASARHRRRHALRAHRRRDLPRLPRSRSTRRAEEREPAGRHRPQSRRSRRSPATSKPHISKRAARSTPTVSSATRPASATRSSPRLKSSTAAVASLPGAKGSSSRTWTLPPCAPRVDAGRPSVARTPASSRAPAELPVASLAAPARPCAQAAGGFKRYCGIAVGRTGFGNVDQSAPIATPLRHIADSDGDAVTPLRDPSPDCAALLAACAHESTAVSPVVVSDRDVNMTARLAVCAMFQTRDMCELPQVAAEVNDRA